MMKRVGLFLFILALGLILPMTVHGESTTTMDVATNVIEWCNVTATSINFGDYTGGALSANGSITVDCIWSSTNYETTLDAGLNYDLTSRRMSDGIGFLRYYLYKDAGFGTQWGDSARANTYPLGTGLWGSGDTTYTVYGQLPGGQVPGSIGTYNDTVTVTVYW